MGYRRFLVALFAVALMSGCSAFDNSSEPFEGFSADEVPPLPGAVVQGELAGFYKGDAVAESNTCGVSSKTVMSEEDAEGENTNTDAKAKDDGKAKQETKLSISMDVTHVDSNINIMIDNGQTAAGELDGEKTTVMTEKGGVRSVYFLTFGKDSIEGSMEKIAPDANGQYSSPCATYKLSLKKGEKVAEKVDEKK